MLSSMDEQEQSRQQNRELREHKVLFHHRLQLLPKVARCGWVSEGMHSKEGWLGLHHAKRIVELSGCEGDPKHQVLLLCCAHPRQRKSHQTSRSRGGAGTGCLVGFPLSWVCTAK